MRDVMASRGPRPTAASYAGSYSEILANRMSDLGISSRKLEELSTYSYEHIRKILKDGAIQSKECNAAVCKALDLDEKAMWEIAQREKLHKKFGNALPSHLVAPQDTYIRQHWQELTNDQQASVRKIIEGMVEQNRLARGTLRKVGAR